MPNKLGFSRPLSGASIADIQQAVNNIYTATGVSETQSGTQYNATANTITNGMSHQTALTTLANKFDAVTGHTHSGNPGDGPPIAASAITNASLTAYLNEAGPFSATGSSIIVTSGMPGGTPASTASTMLGVPVSANNAVVLATTAGDMIDDGSGNLVYGRLTSIPPTGFLLSYYSLVAGVETPYTFAGTGHIDMFYQQLYNPLFETPVYSEEIALRNLNNPLATSATFGEVTLTTSTAQDVGSSGSAGTPNGSVANSNHVHRGMHSLAASGSTAIYGDVVIAPSGSGTIITQVGQTIYIAASAGVAEATTGSFGTVELASSSPQDVAATASSGTANALVANADHIHRGVHSLAASGGSSLYGDVVIAASGSGVTVSQVGNAIYIAASGSGGGGGSTGNYFSGYFSSSSNWNTSSATFVDPTNAGGNALTTVYSNGLTVTAAASNVCGITFTPSSASNVYIIAAAVAAYNASTDGYGSFRLTDGTTNFIWGGYSDSNIKQFGTLYMSGIYAPGTSSAVTVKIQAAAGAGTTYIDNVLLDTSVPSVQWMIIQIK